MKQARRLGIEVDVGLVHAHAQRQHFGRQGRGAQVSGGHAFQQVLEAGQHVAHQLALMDVAVVVPVDPQLAVKLIDLMVQRDLRRLGLLEVQARATALKPQIRADDAEKGGEDNREAEVRIRAVLAQHAHHFEPAQVAVFEPLAELLVDGEGALGDARMPSGDGAEQDVGELTHDAGEVVVAGHRPLGHGDGDREVGILGVEAEHLREHREQQGIGRDLQRTGAGLQRAPGASAQPEGLPLEVDRPGAIALAAGKLRRGGHRLEPRGPVLDGRRGGLPGPQLVAMVPEREPGLHGVAGSAPLPEAAIVPGHLATQQHRAGGVDEEHVQQEVDPDGVFAQPAHPEVPVEVRLGLQHRHALATPLLQVLHRERVQAQGRAALGIGEHPLPGPVDDDRVQHGMAGDDLAHRLLETGDVEALHIELGVDLTGTVLARPDHIGHLHGGQRERPVRGQGITVRPARRRVPRVHRRLPEGRSRLRHRQSVEHLVRRHGDEGAPHPRRRQRVHPQVPEQHAGLPLQLRGRSPQQGSEDFNRREGKR
ncbi:hypothetical protein COSO111634_20105 [Corallococcus soli]